ncbi:hypothetical protein MN608_10807 [Microdochium nivale]|nr:hypothetical protein MN608_10807 [Microdochium nivale]
MDSLWLRAAGCDRAAWLSRVPRFSELIGKDNMMDNDLPQLETVHDALTARVRAAHTGSREQARLRFEAQEALVVFLFVLLLSRLDRLNKFDCRIPISWRGARNNFDPDIQRVLHLMSACAGDSSTNSKVFDSLSENDRAMLLASIHNRNSPLGYLREVRMGVPHSTTARRGLNIDLAQWDPFLALPSMCTFSAANIVAISSSPPTDLQGLNNAFYYTNGSYQWPGIETNAVARLAQFPGRTWSAVEKLDLPACVMDTASIAALVNHMPYLKELRYTHREQRTLSYIWDVSGFLNVIAAACPRDHASVSGNINANDKQRETIGAQLTSLTIGIHVPDRGRCHERVQFSSGAAADSLRKFTALNRLEIDVEVLLGPRTRSGTQKDPFDGYERVPALIDILPNTLEELTLSIGPYTGAAAWLPLLDGFAGGKRKKLPRLSWITIKDTPIRKIWLQHAEWPWAGSSGEEQAAEERELILAAAREIEAEYVVDRRVGTMWMKSYEKTL